MLISFVLMYTVGINMVFGLETQTQNQNVIDLSKKFDRVKRLPIFENIDNWKGFKFVIVGIGGIGFHVAKSLAQTLPIGHMILVDKETLEEENLNRFDVDPLYVGLPKVDVAAQIISALNPYVSVDTYNGDFREVKDEISLNTLTVVIDEVDSAVISRFIYEAAKEKSAIYISMKYNGFDKGTLYVNEIGFDSGLDNPYEIIPSAFFAASIFANILVYFLMSHDPDKIREMKLIKNISLSEVLGVA